MIDEIELPPGITLPSEIRQFLKLDVYPFELVKEENHLWANYSDEWSRTIAKDDGCTGEWRYLLRFNGEKKWLTEAELLTFIKMKAFW